MQTFQELQQARKELTEAKPFAAAHAQVCSNSILSMIAVRLSCHLPWVALSDVGQSCLNDDYDIEGRGGIFVR